MAYQLLRGDTAKNDAYTGPVGSLSVDLEAKRLRVHNGSTAGGATLENSADLNARDTANRNRTNHTGTQLASTISDFSSAVMSTSRLADLVRIARGVTSLAYVDDATDATADLQAAIDSYSTVVLGPGTWLLSNTVRLRSGTRLLGAGEANTTLFFEGNDVSWLFINGDVGNDTYLSGSGYNGDGGILVQDLTIDLNGAAAVNTRAAFIFGRAEDNTLIRVTMKNGKNSHRIECNSQRRFRSYDCTFMDTIDTGDGSYHEEVNIDYNNSAGFPGYGNWDDTPCDDCAFVGCRFIRVQGGISSHSTPATNHQRIKALWCTFDTLARQAVRLQGCDNSIVDNCDIRHAGREAVSIIGNYNRVTGGRIKGASGESAGLYSAVRVQGDGNYVAVPQIETDTGYVYPYPVGVASGSRNQVWCKGAEPGSSGLTSNSGTLTAIDGMVQLYSGAASTTPGTVITLTDSINRYKSLRVGTGGVGSGDYQVGTVLPFDLSTFNVGTDFVNVPSSNGRVSLSVTTTTSLTVASASDPVRKIYGVIA